MKMFFIVFQSTLFAATEPNVFVRFFQNKYISIAHLVLLKKIFFIEGYGWYFIYIT